MDILRGADAENNEDVLLVEFMYCVYIPVPGVTRVFVVLLLLRILSAN